MKKIYVNLTYAMLSQGVATFLNILMYLLVPKFIGSLNYSYWQLFLFYIGYAGFFHFGLVDGIYLKLGGKKYDELNYKLLGSQLKVMSFVQVIIGLIACAVIIPLQMEFERKFVLLSTVIYIIIYCVINFLGFVLQSVNLTKKYSIAIIIDKIINLIAVIILMILKIDDFKPYICIYIFTSFMSMIYLILNSKQIVFSKFIGIKNTIIAMAKDTFVGVFLMFSTVASSLIIGSGRFIVDKIWGIEAFGKISFSISMVNMILLFIRQVSMVLFPALREVSDEKKINIYVITKKLIDCIIPIVFLMYIPMATLLSLWLPKYEVSIQYLSIILPICVYDAKMQVICNTYFKVLRKEKNLLFVNIITMVISLFLSCISGYLFNNMIMVAISMVCSIIFRSILSEIYLDKSILKKEDRTKMTELFIKIIFTITFMVVSYKLNKYIAFVVLFGCLIFYYIINMGDLQFILNFINNKVRVKWKKEKII